MKLNSYKIPKRLEAKEKIYEFSQHFGISFLIFFTLITLYIERQVSYTIVGIITLVLILLLIFHRKEIRRIF